MLSLFTRCISCQSNLQMTTDRNYFPLCLICSESLVSCPNLCKNCGSPLCLPLGPQDPNPTCARPWISNPCINSYSARYLLINPGYSVLRKWKIHGGILFDRQVFKSNSLIQAAWQYSQAEAIIPIPQNYRRAWKMGGSRVERIAQWVGSETHCPIIRALQLPLSLNTHPRKRQASLNLSERLESQIKFQVHSHKLQNVKRVILVDDFRTSGRTLNQAAAALKKSGLEQIHVFCLGIRVFRFNSEEPSRPAQHLISRD